MKLNVFALVLFPGFYAVVLGVSHWKSRRDNGSAGYFLAGRNLSWPLIGISIVAANISTEQFVGMAEQGAGGGGLAVGLWQLVGAIGIVLIALFKLLPEPTNTLKNLRWNAAGNLQSDGLQGITEELTGDFWIGYRRKIFRWIDWRVQFNVRNA